MSHSFYEVADDFWQIITFANINSGVVVFKRHNSAAIPHADETARSTDPIPRPQPLVCLNRNPFPKAVGHPFVFLDRKGFITAQRFCHSQLLFKLGNHLGAAMLRFALHAFLVLLHQFHLSDDAFIRHFKHSSVVGSMPVD